MGSCKLCALFLAKFNRPSGNLIGKDELQLEMTSLPRRGFIYSVDDVAFRRPGQDTWMSDVVRLGIHEPKTGKPQQFSYADFADCDRSRLPQGA